MKVKIDSKEIDAQWCSQMAFKGDPKICQSLCQLLEDEDICFTVLEKTESYSVIHTKTVKVEIAFKMVGKFPRLKVCAFLDEFTPWKMRHTYIVYSESGTKKFQKIIYIGFCDGQDDGAFSDEVFLLTTKVKTLSGTIKSTGEKWKISYSFPFVFDWENKATDRFGFYGAMLIKYKGADENVVIPWGVTRIDHHAFKGNSKIKSVIIPQSVKLMDSCAFSGCINLEYVKIENGIQYVPNWVFKNCKNLTEICFPDSVSKVKWIDNGLIETGYAALSGCKKLKKVVLSSKMKAIPDSFFRGCESLDNIIIPDEIAQIGRFSFAGCKKLKKIILPNGVKSIGATKYFGGASFQNCSSLSYIFIPDTVVKIAKDSFCGCKNMTIYTPQNSYAEKYSMENDIKCVLV